jgi:tetratricopeptide (TPR) repeat protein
MLRTTFMALSVLGAASLLSQDADAAVTVLGNGLAQACFEAAEFGGNARDGIAACNEALGEIALSIRDRAATLVNRGILYARVDELELAVADYTQGLSMEPTMGEGYVDRGAALIVLKRYDDALEDIDKGIALGSSRLHIAYYDRGLVHEAMGNIRAAYDDYKKATEIEPNFALANAELARFTVVHHPANGT